MDDRSTHNPAGTLVVDPPADVRRSPLFLPVNPFALFDLVMSSLVPGFADVAPRPTAEQEASQPAGAEEPERYTLQQAAGLAGLAGDDAARLCRALGFAELSRDSQAYTDADVEAFTEVARLAQDGVIDLDVVIDMVRPMGHLVSRLGAAQVSALAGVAGRPAAAGAVADQPTAQADADQLVPLLEQLVVYAWRRHLVAAASAALPSGRPDAVGPAQTVGFIDITRYTATSRLIDWGQLASLLERFEACVFDEVATSGGRVVKTLGDEVLFVAADPATAAEIALAVTDANLLGRDVPAVHAGLAYGPLLERAGDVFGPTVNIASRITGLARAGSVLVDGACRNRLQADRRFTIQRRPRRPVRGYPNLATYRLLRAAGRP